MEASLTDPWGREYGYELAVEGAPRVWSFGRDGVPGGDDDVALTEPPR